MISKHQNEVADQYSYKTKPSHHLHPLPTLAMLSRTFGVLPMVPVSLTAPLDMVPLTCLPSPIVVRRVWLFITGAVRGLSTLAEKDDSFWLLTIRRAWLAVKRLFSLGGETDMVAAVGLLARR